MISLNSRVIMNDKLSFYKIPKDKLKIIII